MKRAVLLLTALLLVAPAAHAASTSTFILGWRCTGEPLETVRLAAGWTFSTDFSSNQDDVCVIRISPVGGPSDGHVRWMTLKFGWSADTAIRVERHAFKIGSSYTYRMRVPGDVVTFVKVY